jgi:NAD(P)-dependent dehydrogenase (short-subunit alcohol dehydrogenase family)
MSVAIDLSGKIAAVTGAGSGIGRATCLLLAQAGANIVAFDRSAAVFETAEMVGAKSAAMTGDAGVDADVAAMVKLAHDSFGGLDILFANAGISGAQFGEKGARGMTFWDTAPDEWAELLRINLIGPALAIKHGAPAIKARGGGAIICTASVAGLRSGAGPAHYSASKAGVINMVATAAQQLRGTGVRVNAICPGLIETGMTKPIYDGAKAVGREDTIGQLNPLRRGGEPVEIARGVLFLASELGSYVNGHALVIDGGLSSSHPITMGEMKQVLDI